MCGFAGALDLRGAQVDPAVANRMAACLHHRGPDDSGLWSSGPIALGHRRLSILDLETGDQPLANEDGSVQVVYNGEIYNFRALRQELEGRRHRFRTRSDTETIVHAYEEEGAGCVRRLRGMFAFALWDERRRRLLLARDRVGKKPLFYTVADDRLLFASELHALLRDPSVRRELDPAAIDEYLTYGYIAAPRTIFRGVHKLPPAHYLEVDLGTGVVPEPVRYWSLDYVPKLDLGIEEAEEAFLEKLKEAVRLRMVADVPIGALLSGGVDSSLVVALMAEASDRPVSTFSIGFEESAFNELPYARMVAERYATDHHEMVVRPNALEVLPTLVRHYGEPFADSSAIPTYYVAKLTRRHVKVVLNGDGGDECAGGYERYLGALLAERYRRLPRVLSTGIIEPLAGLIPDRLPPRSRLRQAKRFLAVAGRPFGKRYTRWMTFFTAAAKQRLYSPEFMASLGEAAPERWLERLAEEGAGDALDRLLAADTASYLPYDLLVKMDIATMANSLEARSPFLDHELLELSARLPSTFKVRGRTLKYLSKRVARRFVPREVIHRRKMGFGAPIGPWLRGELRPLLEDVLLSRRALERGYFRPPFVRRLVTEHLEGHDHSFQLWSLLWLELWHREFADVVADPVGSGVGVA